MSDTNPARAKDGTKRYKEIGKRQYQLLSTVFNSPDDWHKLVNIDLDEGTQGTNHKYYIVKDYVGRGFIKRKKEGRCIYIKITPLGISYFRYHKLTKKWEKDDLTEEESIQYRNIKNKLESLGFKLMSRKNRDN